MFLGYPTVVLTGAAAARLPRQPARPAAWPAVALRRSALRVDPAGPADGDACTTRGSPPTRSGCRQLDGVGDVEAVAEPGADLAVGEQVRLTRGHQSAAPCSLTGEESTLVTRRNSSRWRP